jgi:hypothetical protein
MLFIRKMLLLFSLPCLYERETDTLIAICAHLRSHLPG